MHFKGTYGYINMSFSNSIAIVGIGGIFPASPNLQQFWYNIVNKVNASAEIPKGRWPVDVDDVYSTQKGVKDKVYSRRACFIDDFKLDTSGLNIDPDFLLKLDPLFHLAIHAGRDAYTDCRKTNFDKKRAKVIIGNIVLPSELSSKLAMQYLGKSFDEMLDNDVVNKTIKSRQTVDPVSRYVAGLPGGVLAKALGFEGGSYTLDAACASSLYAISLAMDELSAGRADAVLAGGVSRPDCFYTQMGFSQLHALSPNGISAPFDKESNGLVVGEGAGMFMLKRLQDAIDAGDNIYGCIKGVGLSNDVDGSLLAPNSEGQLRAMRQAYEISGWSPGDVDLIECHATGTPVGDVVEFQSLQQLWGKSNWKNGQCIIGSVKSNIGHLLTAAGSAALMKVVLALKDNVMPPTANFKSPGRDIDLNNSPFRLLTEPVKWEKRNSETPRRAGISAFGFGGINAHMLFEEWMPETQKSLQTAKIELKTDETIDIAITGMDVHVGNWKSLTEFSDRIFNDQNDEIPYVTDNWNGAQSASWFKHDGFNSSSFKGFYINELKIPFNKFRIPPKELKEILPQQLLMLNVTNGAIQDGRVLDNDRLNTSVIIGIGLDLNTTNFHFRWMMRNRAKELVKTSGLNVSQQELDELTNELMESAGPALTANRTLGALGGVVASRIAREFRLGGPSFTVSNEECSGLRALETAVRLIQTNKIKQAVVGAVDLAGDIRSVLSANAERPFSLTGLLKPFDENADGTIPSDGAAAVIVKSLKDAIVAGDKIYAVIKGIGSATGGDPSNHIPSKNCCVQAIKGAYDEAHITIDSIDLIETNGSGLCAEDKIELEALSELMSNISDDQKSSNGCAISSVKADVGHTGAAAGLISLVKTALCLHHETIPGIRNFEKLPEGFDNSLNKLYFPESSRYWLRNRVDGPRRAGVTVFSMDSNCSHVVLEEYKESFAGKICVKENRVRGFCGNNDELFAFEFKDARGLFDGIKRLQQHIQKHSSRSLKYLAGTWWQHNKFSAKNRLAFALIVENQAELLRLIDKTLIVINSDKDLNELKSIDDNRAFYSSEPLGRKGEVAFVYPGSGTHYPGMGRELLKQWPGIVRHQDELSRCLKSQFAPELFWNVEGNININRDKRGVLLGMVSIGCFVTDLIQSFGVKPDASIGYSLGESTALLSLKAWKDRDEMYRRIMESDLFVDDLAGRYNAARAAWGLKDDEEAKWVVYLIVCAEAVVRQVVEKVDRAYLLIVNSPKDCVIGGDEESVNRVVKELRCRYFPLEGVTIAHCEIVEQVFDKYRNFHLFDVTPLDGTRVYSGSWEKAYKLTSKKAADSIAAHALKGFNFPKLIEKAYNDGIRVFVEIGPGSSCCRMIDDILGSRPHSALHAINSKQNENRTIMKLLAQLIVQRVDINLDVLYGNEEEMESIDIAEIKDEDMAVITVGGKPFQMSNSVSLFLDKAGRVDINEFGDFDDFQAKSYEEDELVLSVMESHESVIQSMRKSLEAKADAHEAFLKLSNNIALTMKQNIEFQLSMIGSMPDGVDGVGDLGSGPDNFENIAHGEEDKNNKKDVSFDRDKCMEFAIGKIGNVLGSRYAEIDNYPTRVRLPDEPMMFVDRIILVEGEQLSLKSGRVVTEHDIKENAWYLDCNRIPTCVAVEAGQADLFLSGYLGIDFETKGLAVYRLLDAVVTFYRELPQPGDTIKYDIHIQNFFKHGKTYLFRFNFEATVNGEPLLSMKEGCAGFFTSKELYDGKGIIEQDADNSSVGVNNKHIPEIVPMGIESYDKDKMEALRSGDLAGCFGLQFENLNISQPSVIPGGMMKLVDRITRIDPHGGNYGLGFVQGEADIHKDDWFLICHFVDDRVMPGTLMYECCMHTLRVYLLRMGWVGEKDELVYQPVPGVGSGLKCRGQVLESTKLVTYEISIKEIGYRPEAYVICDALMYADNKAIVKISDMSLRISGLTEETVNKVWNNERAGKVESKKAIFDTGKILAFATGKPSEAFGKPYECFDNDRKIARLPGPPYKFLDRIVEINAEPWKMVGGGVIEAEYDIPVGEWYFKENCQEVMSFAILLEIALQPCGWLAAYSGSALSSDIDLCFRNLGGKAIITRPVYCNTGTLSITVKMTQVSQSGGMIIQHYDFHVRNKGKTVYKGNTYFGFFTKEALAQQIGIRDAKIYKPTESELACGTSFEYPTESPYPAKMMRMLDRIELFVNDGGPKGLGLIQGSKDVNPDEWFFKAHFYQDPVCPGSLGLESFLQLLKVVAVNRWGVENCAQMETIAVNEEHTWVYRGQVIPADNKVFVEAIVTEIDDKQRLIRADGFLSVDGRVIYQMTDFTLKVI